MTTAHAGPTRATYYKVFLALMVLLVATVAVAYVDLGAFNAVVALTIAVIKALLVILIFMQVKYSEKMVWLAASAGFFFLFILLTISLTDYLWR